MEKQQRVQIDDTLYETEIPEPHRSKIYEGMPDPLKIRAIIPGTVLELKVNQGQKVDVGQVVLILEAMKMYNEIEAEKSGRVEEIFVAPGDVVEKNQLLVKMVE